MHLNEGTGAFSDSGQYLGSALSRSKGVTLGDMDGKGGQPFYCCFSNQGVI